MTDSLVFSQISGSVATLTLNRPDKLNAINESLCERLMNAVNAAVDNPNVRCLVLTGAGRAFSAGGDAASIKRLGQASFDEACAIMRRSSELIELLVSLPKPTIAKLNGAAMGGGAAIALACDFVVAVDSASIGFVFGRIGLTPDMGMMHLLPQAVGVRKARQLCLLNCVLTASEAKGIGLVNEVVSAAELDATVEHLTAALALSAPRAVSATKTTLAVAEKLSLAELLDREAEIQAALWGTTDVQEGLRAFAEKRQPEFTGH